MLAKVVTADDCRDTSDALDGIGPPARAAYLRDFLRLGPALLASTTEQERFVLAVDGTPIPVVVNDGREKDCYLLSPYAHYVKYARLEFDKISGMQARLLGRAVTSVGRLCLPLGFNRCLSVNNWLFTTSPDLRLTPSQLATVTRTLVERHPGLPIIFRCVDARDPATQRTFADAGYKLVVNRPVHEWHPERTERKHRRQARHDLKKLLHPPAGLEVETPATLPPGAEEDVHRLYSLLYIQKHAGYNCRYTARFFRAAHDTGVMQFVLVRLEGRIVAFCTLFEDGDRTVLSLVGYDTALDRQKYPLYRMMMAHGLRLGFERNRLIFLSTGAATFKHNRGSKEWMEYEAVYDRHLPGYRRLPWSAFKAIYDRGVKDLDTLQI
jgi:hypothetical protein